MLAWYVSIDLFLYDVVGMFYLLPMLLSQDIDCGGFLEQYMVAALNDNVLSIAAVDTALTHLFTVQVFYHRLNDIHMMLLAAYFLGVSLTVPLGHV